MIIPQVLRSIALRIRLLSAGQSSHGASISLLGDSEKEHLQYLESFTYTRNDTTCTITGYTGTSTHLVIPEAINGYRVTAVAEHAFDNCSGLQEIVLPKTLQEFAPLHTTQYLLLVYANSSTEQALQQAVSAKEHAEDIKLPLKKPPPRWLRRSRKQNVWKTKRWKQKPR